MGRPRNRIKERLDGERAFSVYCFFGGPFVSDEQFRAPAGWYPDPLGLPQLRWWNNHGWTEQVSAAPEPVLVQEPRLAWKEAEPAVSPVQQAPTAYRPPTPPQPKVSTSLQELEGPRPASTATEPSDFDDWQANFVPSVAAAAPVAAAPAAPMAPAPTPPPPAYWDAEDDSRPNPSIRPEDLKFWSGTSPAELRRQTREKAAQT